MSDDTPSVVMHNRFGAAWPVWAAAVGLIWDATADGLPVPVSVILVLQVAFTAARCPWRTVVTRGDQLLQLDIALGPLGLVRRRIEAREVRLRFNRVEASPARGVPVPYWLAPLMPWNVDRMEARLRVIGVTASS
jgi:hypothetical protein